MHPLRIRWEETDRPTSLRSDERSRSPESVFTTPGFGVQLHRNAQNAPDRAAGVDVLHRDTVDDHATEGPVAGLQCCASWADQSAQGVIERVAGKIGVELGQRGAQAHLQNDVTVVIAFRIRRIGSDLRAVNGSPARAIESGQSGGFDGRFGEPSHRLLSSAHSWLARHSALVMGWV